MTVRALRRGVILAVIVTALAAPLAWAQGADVTVSKSGPAEAAAGSNVSYSVTVSNLDPETSATVTLTDPIPAGMTFVSATPAGCSAPAPGSGGTITCLISDLAGGASVDFTFVFHIPSGTAPGTTFTNIATATSPTDPNSENNSGVAVTSTPSPPQADVTVSKTGPASAAAGSDVPFTIAITNLGPGAAANVTWQDTLPGTMTFVSLVPSSGPGLTCSIPAVGSGGTINCTLASLAAGATATFTLTGHVPPSTPSETTYANTVTVSAATADPSTENNADTTSLTVTPGSADLGVTKTGVVGGSAINPPVTYTIVVTNQGPDDASDVVVTDVLPAGSVLSSATTTQGSCTGTTTVVCAVGTLSPGGSATITLVVFLAKATGPISNTATVTSATSDPNPANNSSTADVVIAAAIPALSPLTFALLGITLAAVGFFVLRVRRSATTR